jgi:superfamily II DNA helicase RecQ
VVVIIAIGERKSLLFILPCILPNTGVTILVLLLVFLQGDLLRRVQELGIDHLVWSPSEQQDAPLVFVMVEVVYTKQFRTYAYKLVATQDLGRIVFDKAHLTIIASDYR